MDGFIPAFVVIAMAFGVVGLVYGGEVRAWRVGDENARIRVQESAADVALWLRENLDDTQFVAFEAKFFPAPSAAERVVLKEHELRFRALVGDDVTAVKEELEAAKEAAKEEAAMEADAAEIVER